MVSSAILRPRGLEAFNERVLLPRLSRLGVLGSSAIWNMQDADGATAISEYFGRANGTKSATGLTLGASGPVIDGQVTRGIGFNGSSGVITTPATAPTGAYTFCAWIKYVSGKGPVVSLTNAANPGHAIYLNNQGNNQPMILANTNGSNYRYFGAINLADDKWHFIAVTMPGNAQADIASSAFYVDGVTLTAGGTVQSGAQAVRSTVCLGKSISVFFNGTLSQTVIAPVALTASEIWQIYRTQKYGEF